MQFKAQQQALPQRGDFVRVRRGVYANDLAQIVSADEQGVYVTARLIPRIDLAAMLDRESVSSCSISPCKRQHLRKNDG